MELTLKFAKVTKNFVKFDAEAPVLGSLYIPKELVPNPESSELLLTITDESPETA